eukprot:365811-Chlamydomonas_euryale.AAC.31
MPYGGERRFTTGVGMEAICSTCSCVLSFPKRRPSSPRTSVLLALPTSHAPSPHARAAPPGLGPAAGLLVACGRLTPLAPGMPCARCSSKKRRLCSASLAADDWQPLSPTNTAAHKEIAHKEIAT